MLARPDYIPRLEIADGPVDYVWNDADPGSIHLQNERLATVIGGTTDRGVVALSCGFAEWIAWRLHEKVDVLVLLNEVEAVWAAVIDWRYLGPLNRDAVVPTKKEWRGPLRGPVFSTFYLLAEVVWRARGLHYSAEASSCLSSLAAHVVPVAEPFFEWRRQVIQRLRSLYPFVLKDRVGPPVPREALDPNYAFRPDLEGALLDQFLQSLDYTQNPFLRSPDQMIADGFEGEPYRFVSRLENGTVAQEMDPSRTASYRSGGHDGS